MATSRLDNGLQGLNPGTGTPHKGGTLNMLGVGDVDYMDYNASYYTIGYLLAADVGPRACTPTRPSRARSPRSRPDLATGCPCVSNSGKTYTVTIRTGADWNTSPARQVTGADAMLGLKRSCNPTPAHFGGLAGLRGHRSWATTSSAPASPRSRPTSLSAIKNYMNTHHISGVTASGNTVTYNLTQPVELLRRRADAGRRSTRPRSRA